MGLTEEEFRQQLRQEFVPIRNGLKEIKELLGKIIELREKRKRLRSLRQSND